MVDLRIFWPERLISALLIRRAADKGPVSCTIVKPLDLGCGGIRIRSGWRKGCALLLAAGWLCGVRAGQAAEVNTNSVPDPADLSLEQLVNIQVTSVSKKETSLSQAPAAIAVVTPDDIRRQGITSLPEALRLVPGMDVARINNHEWAISARGFNGQFANKQLVLVDGRSVYGPGFGGVVWGVEDVVLEDLDRIEVIRGPGGTLWGANAVNGVINIMTKSAKETQGALVSTTFGTENQPLTTVRYGGQLATNLYYRAYIKYDNRQGFETSSGDTAPDRAREIQGGFRIDWEPTAINQLTLQGDYYDDRFIERLSQPIWEPPYSQELSTVNHNSGDNVLGRWTHDFSTESTLTVQAYYDRKVNEQAQAIETTDNVDLDVQHRLVLGSRNDFVWGFGYRRIDESFQQSDFIAFSSPQQDQELYSAFIQDEFTLLPERLKLTAGTKCEHNDFTEWEVQPSARLAWTPTARQTYWAAISRAVRTPSRADFGGTTRLQIIPPQGLNPLPTELSTMGDARLQSEELLAYEVGGRLEVTRRVSLDAALFYNDYQNVIVPVPNPFIPMVPGAGTVPPHSLYSATFQNAGKGQTYGAELSARWQVTDQWRLTASYSLIQWTFNIDNPLLDSMPRHQFQIRSDLDLPAHLELSSAVYFVDRTEAPYGAGEIIIPSYFRVDIGLTWRPFKNLEIGIWGQNLQADQHQEFTSYKTSLITEIPRSVLGKITWHF